jgi:hypothetical protein
MESAFSWIRIITLLRICYDRYGSFRIRKIGTQPIDELTQFVHHGRMVPHCAAFREKRMNP